MNTLRLALGPIQYYWPKDKLVTFYREVADMPVDIVWEKRFARAGMKCVKMTGCR